MPAGSCSSPTRASRRPATRPGSPSRSGSTASRPSLFDGARVEPTDESLDEAIDFARDAESTGRRFDAIVAVGGGSSIDTAKAVNLLLTNPGELMDYINAPVGKAQAPAPPLLPLVAIPTTTGTGSESTTICVLDVLSLQGEDRDQPPRAASDAGRSSTRGSP